MDFFAAGNLAPYDKMVKQSWNISISGNKKHSILYTPSLIQLVHFW